jgi:hypothetical protein
VSQAKSEPSSDSQASGACFVSTRWSVVLSAGDSGFAPRGYGPHGKEALFHALEPCLIGSRETQPYAALGAELGMTEGAARVAVCRLREQYRECLKAEIANTVASAAEVDEELRHLLRVMARR